MADTTTAAAGSVTVAGAEADGPLRFAICVATFYGDLAERLVAGAREGFAEAGIDAGQIDIFEVPGAFELPLAALLCLETGNYHGVACLGVVIRGETSHYDHVCAETARGIQDVSLMTSIPCAFGVITCENRDQAEARTGGGKRDQGRNAAAAVLQLVAMRQRLEQA